MTSYAIETSEISKSYKNVTAVDELNLSVPSGSIFGFLGPNGAGKTTTIRLITGLIKPDKGKIHLSELNLASNRCAALTALGALIETPTLYHGLTGNETLEISRLCLGLDPKEIGRVLNLTGMLYAANRRVSEYSLGMKQRLAIARALMGKPKLLILDEPTNGLDPVGLADMRALFKRLNGEGKTTTFLSSHILSEVEQVATDVALIQNGRLIFQGSASSLVTSLPSTVLLETPQLSRAMKLLKQFNITGNIVGTKIQLNQYLDEQGRIELLNSLIGSGLSVSGLTVNTPPLEEVFMHMTNRGAN